MKNIYKVKLATVALLSSFSISYAGKIFVFTTPTTSDNKITIAEEAREILTDRHIEYNLDPAIPSPFGNNTGARIVFRPYPGSLEFGDYFVISLNNAYFSDKLKKCWLMFYEHNGVDTDGDGIGDQSYDMTNDGDTNDSIIIAESLKIDKSNLLMRVTDYKEIRYKSMHPESILYLACAEEDEPIIVDEDRSVSDPPASFDDMYNIVLNFKKPSGSPIIIRDRDKNSVCIELSEAYTCCPSVPLNSLKTQEKACFINFKNQFSIDMTPAVSYINAYPDLNNVNCSNSKSGLKKCYIEGTEASHRFVGSGLDILESNVCTEEYASSGSISILNNPDNDIEDPIRLSPTGWKGKISIEIYDMNHKYTCTNTGYPALDFENNRLFIDNNGDPESNAPGDPIDARGAVDIPINPGNSCYAQAYVYESGTPSEDTVIAPQITGWKDDIYIGVDGNNYIKMVRWGLKYKFSILDNDNNVAYSYQLTESDEPVLKKVASLSCCYDNDYSGYFLLWKPNGDEAYVPYMLNSNQFKVIISNNSCWDAEIYARVWDSKGRVIDNVYLGKVRRNSVRILTGDFVFKKAQQLLPELGRGASPLYSMILTVGAPKRDVEFAGYDNRQGKTKMIPVYDLDAHDWTYRNVDFDTDTFGQ